MKRSTITSLGLLLMLLLAACTSTGSIAPGSPASTTSTISDSSIPSSSESGSGQAADVTIEVFQFTPGELTIQAGESVTWLNSDRIDHTVTSGVPDTPTGRFDMTLPEAGATAVVSFDEPGTYAYFCSIHPHMRGTITVENLS